VGAPLVGRIEERVPPGPCYAVIFANQHAADTRDYGAVGARMVELAQTMPGYLGYQSARGADGYGITVSYWDSRANIANFRANLEHAAAQARGREQFYAAFDLRVARVERRITFDARSGRRTEESL
jgi:heme-degrading monooxygenase HmoA